MNSSHFTAVANLQRPFRTRSRVFAFLRVMLVMLAPAAGYIVGSASTASGLYVSAGASGLREQSGGEQVSFLSVSASADNWFDCNGSNCSTYVRYFTVGWSINDGSSTFVGVAAKYLGAEFWCEGQSRYYIVNAGPYNPYGSWTLNFGTLCTVGYGTLWNPYAGMCDTAQDCAYWPQYGPRISWVWSPPSTSASLFQYWW